MNERMKFLTNVLLQAGLVPGSYVGMGNDGTGCFTRGAGISMGRSFSNMHVAVTPILSPCCSDSAEL